jgi:serine protease AprX
MHGNFRTGKLVPSLHRVAVGLILFASILLAQNGKPKLASDFQGKGREAFVDAIVVYQKGAGKDSKQKLQSKGALMRASHDLVNMAVFRAKLKDLEDLEDDPEVLYVAPDRKVSAHLALANQTSGAWAASNYNLTGNGVGVAVIDSGVSSHPDFGSMNCAGNRVVYNQSFVPGDASTNDAYGHGTHVAGIIAGNGNCTGTLSTLPKMRGIAPGANIINLRVLGADGSGTDSAVIAAISRAIQIRNQQKIKVINLSLGRAIKESYRTDPLCLAAEAAVNAGILVVTSAGNFGRNQSSGLNGYGSITSPANDPWVLTVGAINMKGTSSRGDDVVASFSSKGPSLGDRIVKPDIVAPGNRIPSALALGSVLQTSMATAIVAGGYPALRYIELSGTSMATPIVAAAAALLYEKESNLSPGQVKTRLMRTATKSFSAASTYTVPGSTTAYTTHHDLFTVGAGHLDIAAALASNISSTEGAVSPAAARLALLPYDTLPVAMSVHDINSETTGSSTVTVLVNAPSATTSQSVSWTTVGPNLYGTLNVSGSTVLGGSNKPWGNSTTSAFSILWGETILWGDTVLWGDSVLWGDRIAAADLY